MGVIIVVLLGVITAVSAIGFGTNFTDGGEFRKKEIHRNEGEER